MVLLYYCYNDIQHAVCNLSSAIYRRCGKIHWAKCSRFNPTEVFLEIFLLCLCLKCLLFCIIKERQLQYIHRKTFAVFLKQKPAKFQLNKHRHTSVRIIQYELGVSRDKYSMRESQGIGLETPQIVVFFRQTSIGVALIDILYF